jgi:hypothetical protein
VGLVWAGEYLLVASERLYKFATSGVVASYNLPVRSITKGIAWDSEAVWVLNDGPKEVKDLDPKRAIRTDPVITRFKLR